MAKDELPAVGDGQKERKERKGEEGGRREKRGGLGGRGLGSSGVCRLARVRWRFFGANDINSALKPFTHTVLFRLIPLLRASLLGRSTGAFT